MLKHVVVDTETIGTGPRSGILSIGATKFYADQPISNEFDTFYCNVNLKSALQYGQLDSDTLCWWLDDGRAEARKSLDLEGGLDLPVALQGFSDWWFDDAPGLAPVAIWSNGATFDLVILRHAYAMVGQDCPWPFWRERCFRTIKSLKSDLLMPPRHDVAHTALADAVHQTNWLLAIRDNLELRLG